MCSTVLYPSVLCFGWLDWSQIAFDCVRPKRAIIRTAQIKLVMFRPTGLKQDVFDHVRPKRKRAMFPFTRPELVILCQTRLKLKCVWPCSTQAQACYICSESTWTGYVFARLDQKLKVFDRVRPNRAMFRLTRLKPNCAWLRSTQARYNSNGSNQTGYVSTYRTEARCVWPCSTQAQACHVSIYSTWTGYTLPDTTETKMCLTMFDPCSTMFDPKFFLIQSNRPLNCVYPTIRVSSNYTANLIESSRLILDSFYKPFIRQCITNIQNDLYTEVQILHTRKIWIVKKNSG